MRSISATGCRSITTRRRCGRWRPYVDAIATNYNVDSSDGWIAPYYFEGLKKLSGGKPVLVSEWFFAARHNRTGNRNNGHLMTVETQAERAAGAAAATENFAAIPQIVGAHWFQYYDHPKGGRADGEDYDFGLVDINDLPYRRLTAALGDGQPQHLRDPRGRRTGRADPPGGKFCRAARRGGVARPLAVRLAEAGEPDAASDPLARCGRFRRGLSELEPARAAAGDDRPGLLRPRSVGL